MGMLGTKSAAVAAAVEMVRYMNEFKFTRSVVFATQLHRQYRPASG